MAQAPGTRPLAETDLRDELGLAYLLISHDLAVIAHLADRIAVMYRGALVELGPAESVLRPPYHPYTEALLSAVPVIGGGRHPTQRIRLSGGIISAVTTGCHFSDRCPRRIGTICDTTPSLAMVTAHHAIRCHIPFAELGARSTVAAAE